MVRPSRRAGNAVVVSRKPGASMSFRGDMGAGSTVRRHSVGIGASATGTPPMEDCEIAHFSLRTLRHAPAGKGIQ